MNEVLLWESKVNYGFDWNTVDNLVNHKTHENSRAHTFAFRELYNILNWETDCKKQQIRDNFKNTHELMHSKSQAADTMVKEVGNWCDPFRYKLSEVLQLAKLNKLNKRAMMALDRSPESWNVICHANLSNSFCSQVSQYKRPTERKTQYLCCLSFVKLIWLRRAPKKCLCTG